MKDFKDEIEKNEDLEEKEEKSKKKIIWRIIFILSLIVFIVSLSWILLYYLSGNEDINRFLTNEDSTAVEASSNVVMAENHDINWDALEEENNDIYAWIYIPNTLVDYPIVQPTNEEGNAFYLHKGLDKAYNFAGSIYTEIKNAKDFSDPVTLIYGHNMLNDTMFATLHNFEDPAFFKENKNIYIYMPNRKLTYKIYAAYVYDDRHILNSFDFSDEKILLNYFKYTQNPDSMTKNTREVELDVNSKIITLSTCTSGASNTRYLVQGVLIKDEPTN